MMRRPSLLQLTVAIIKPDLYCRPKALETVRSEIIQKSLYIIRNKEVKWKLRDAEKFYEEHKRSFFYDRLVRYMSSGPMSAMVLAGDNAIHSWRSCLGPARSYIARFRAPDSIRGRYGVNDTRNSVHGADSAESVRREMNLLFPEFNVPEWYTNEERQFRDGKLVKYCDTRHIHVLI